MTQLRWTEPANSDFLSIIAWLLPRSQTAAEQIGQTILAAVDRLRDYPHLGKAGRSPNTRELHVAKYPYWIVYEVAPGAPAGDPPQITILRVLHGAMLWPPTSAEQ